MMRLSFSCTVQGPSGPSVTVTEILSPTRFAAEGIKKLRSLYAPQAADSEPEHAPPEQILRLESIGTEPNLDHGAKAAGAPSDSASSAAAATALPVGDYHHDDLRVSLSKSSPAVSEKAQAGSLQTPDAVVRQETTKMDLNEGLTLWRGMRNTKVTDAFAKFGGTELSLMSTTTDSSVAVRYSLSPFSLLFKIKAVDFMSMGADLKWLSAFPGEAEFLYPPLTYLKPTGRTLDISLNKGENVFRFNIVEVIPIMG